MLYQTPEIANCKALDFEVCWGVTMKMQFFPLFGLLAGWIQAAEMNMEWAYHDDADGIDHRVTERVPGQDHPFLANGTAVIDDGQEITLYLLTANQFAGDAEEQVFLRWWNGAEEHWVAGEWVRNIRLGEGEEAVGPFHGYPQWGQETIDLWKVTVSAELTRPGDNYYTIQLKAWSEEDSSERYLLREMEGEFGSKNKLGQAWTAAPEGYFGRDWMVTITE